MLNFLDWLREQNESMPYYGNSPTPASNEVIRTGKQPQVDMDSTSNYEKQGQKISQDAVMALDTQLNQMKLLIQNICQEKKIPECETIDQAFEEFASVVKQLTQRPIQLSYDQQQLPNRVPNNQQRNMMNTMQPPPMQTPPMGGGVSDFTNTM